MKVKVEEVDGGCRVEGGSINTSGRKNNMTMTTKKCPVFSSVSAGTDATSRAGIELRSRQKRSRVESSEIATAIFPPKFRPQQRNIQQPAPNQYEHPRRPHWSAAV